MPATKISNPRDLLVQLLGELFFVERRLADEVLDDLVRQVSDAELKAVLEHHRDETKQHADRIQTVFRRLEIAPTSNLSRSFESSVAEHAELGPSIVDTRLADLYHAQAALHTEHWEVASYRAVLALLPRDLCDLLRPSLEEEGRAEADLLQAIDRLAHAA